MDTKTKSDRSNLIVPLAVIAALVPLLGGIIWYLERSPRAAQESATLTAEAKAYTRNLRLSGVEMKATANYVGATVVEIVGNIQNAGDRGIGKVELTCIFYDAYGQVVLRERVPIVRTALAPGQTRSFRLPFENPPGSWNRALPQLVIASISFS